MQCNIAFVSDAHTEGKVSVTPKSWLPRNNRKTYYNTFAVSAELAYGQPSQEAPVYVTKQLIDDFYVGLLSGILIEKCSFLAACQFNAKSGIIDQVTLGDQPAGQPWSWSISVF